MTPRTFLESVLDAEMSWSDVFLVSAVVGITYVVFQVFYQLYFSPLAGFPGPKLAAVSRAYELYHDLILGGQYTFKIRDLHAKYGS